MTFILLRVTTPDLETARALARQLVEGKLAASCHVGGPTESLYWWENQTHQGREYYCEARTSEALLEPVTALILAAHPFEVPEMFHTPIQATTLAYKTWLETYASGGQT